MSGSAAVDRAAPADVVNLAVDHGSVPMQIAALLTFDPADRPPAAALEAALGARLARVPRLRRRLEATPFGCGRPVWVDDPGFALGRHLDVRTLPTAEEDPGATAAVELLLQRLPRDRPLWRARILTDTGRAAGVVVVMHHALADGIGGLAVLATLVDGAQGEDPAAGTPPRVPAPTVRELAADAWSEFETVEIGGV
ncbi:MAG TPA: wax ester/triacylglycerol synthase family O-acyltransferase, partial [Nocardioides sp.]|uniref:wax ester/triacylglycerol synthase domain-containing protein n=1 Tax=Nocardioides sp. TaxID=35761 RepID=UPI002BD96CEB